VIATDDLTVGDWVMYEWRVDDPGSNSERIGKIIELNDPLVLVHPGSDETLAFDVSLEQLTRTWIPEGNPDAGARAGHPGEQIEADHDD
jgi:hypothetical protein